MPAKIVLKVIAGPIEGEVFSFDEQDTFLFGRHNDCHARLPDDGRVSRHHFLLEANPPHATLRDLGSRNGTYVNGVKYGGRKSSESPKAAAQRAATEIDLKDGDRIRVGRTQIQVQVILPVTCRECGKEPDDDQVDAGSAADGCICIACRALIETHTHSDSTPHSIVSCEHCGKKFAPDDWGTGSAQPVCKACQSELMSDDLRGIFQDATEPLVTDEKPRISGYEIGEEIGHGAMAYVYRASRDSDGLPVAIKVATSHVTIGESARGRFEREIKIVRSLRHDHIARLLDHGVQRNTLFFVLEFCNGGSLNKLLARQGGKLPLETAVPIMLQCLSGLEYAHGQQVVHRDIKPGNILLHQHQGNWIAKIADFGLAKSFATASSSGMTATGSGGGTYPYMPREQLTEFKSAKPPSDIWGIAATFYRVLTGCPPRDCPTSEDALRVILDNNAVPIRQRDPGIPKSVAEVIDRALQTKVEDRYQSVDEMRNALNKALAAVGPSAK